MDTAFTSTLSGSQGLGKYDILTETVFGNENSCSFVGTYTEKSTYQSMQYSDQSIVGSSIEERHQQQWKISKII